GAREDFDVVQGVCGDASHESERLITRAFKLIRLARGQRRRRKGRTHSIQVVEVDCDAVLFAVGNLLQHLHVLELWLGLGGSSRGSSSGGGGSGFGASALTFGTRSGRRGGLIVVDL